MRWLLLLWHGWGLSSAAYDTKPGVYEADNTV
jgi:hypothetical protein